MSKSFAQAFSKAGGFQRGKPPAANFALQNGEFTLYQARRTPGEGSPLILRLARIIHLSCAHRSIKGFRPLRRTTALSRAARDKPLKRLERNFSIGCCANFIIKSKPVVPMRCPRVSSSHEPNFRRVRDFLFSFLLTPKEVLLVLFFQEKNKKRILIKASLRSVNSVWGILRVFAISF